MSHFNELTTYIELTKHTLLVAQTKGLNVQLFRECSLLEKPSVEEAFNAIQADWKVVGLHAVTALSPQPAYWHRATQAEASQYRTEQALRQFGGSLPHTLNGALELTACHSADGTLISPDGHARWLLGVTAETSLALARANAAECRIETVRTESATLGQIGAIVDSLRFDDHGAVMLWDLAVDRSHVFLVTSRGVQAVVPCNVGLEDIFTAVQTTLGLSFRGAATRVFYDPVYDFADAAHKIAAYIAPALKAACASLPSTAATPSLACTGLTGSQSWFVKEAAHATGLQPWSPKIPALCSVLKLRFASPEIETSLTPASLGLLHLVSSTQQRMAVWHPAWSHAGITRLATAAPFFAPPLPVAPTSVTPAPVVSNEPTRTVDSAPASAPISPRKPAPRLKPTLKPGPARPPVPIAAPVAPRPVLAPKMSEVTVSRLRDEALAHICRKFLREALSQLENNKRQILGTRPPFGLLGSKKSIQAYESSLRSAQETEINYLQQLKDLEPIEHWLQSSLQELLHEYLNAASPEYHGYSEACVLVERWQNYVGDLHEFAMGFARDARVAAMLLNGRNSAGSLPLRQATENLRTTASHLHAQNIRIEMVTKEVAGLTESGKVNVALPALPAFPHGTWVDRMMLLNPYDATRELKRQEDAARAFCEGGKNELILRAESIRSLCLKTRLEYLNKYWGNLRPRVIAQCTETGDMKKLFTDLMSRYLEADLRRRQEAETNNPFALVR